MSLPRTRIASLTLPILRTQLRPTTAPLATRPLQQPQPTRSISISGAYNKLFRKWRGVPPQEHAVDRTKHNADTTDPETKASGLGMEERDRKEGIADRSQSQATTERGGLAYGRKAKDEHPRAPEPVIGMNDERAQV